MERFMDLLERSVIVQGIITIGAGLTVSTLYLMGRPIPPELWQLVTFTFAFYFGSKSQSEISAHFRSQAREREKRK